MSIVNYLIDTWCCGGGVAHVDAIETHKRQAHDDDRRAYADCALRFGQPVIVNVVAHARGEWEWIGGG